MKHWTRIDAKMRPRVPVVVSRNSTVCTPGLQVIAKVKSISDVSVIKGPAGLTLEDTSTPSTIMMTDG
jgi:hypothetical protein